MNSSSFERHQDAPHEKGNTSPYLDSSSELVASNCGFLPHWHQDGKLQFLTFHLADSLPQEVLAKIEEEKEWYLSRPEDDPVKKRAGGLRSFLHEKTEAYLGAGYGACILKEAANREIVARSILYADGAKYDVHAFVIMPNHVHILVAMKGKYTVSHFLKNLKGFSAHALNQKMGTHGTVWHKESFDRMIRNEQHYRNVLRYIQKNAGICPGQSTLYVREGGVVEEGNRGDGK